MTAPADSPAETIDTLIVGGGMAGLAVAWNLLRRAPDRRVLLVEAEGRVGGNVRTVRHEGSVVDLGPDVLVARDAGTLEVCEALGVAMVRPSAAVRCVQVVRKGRISKMPEGLVLGVPRDFGALATTPLVSLRGKLRAACDLLMPPRSTDGLSLGQIVERRLGREVKDVLVEPLVAGMHGGDLDRLETDAVFPQLSGVGGSVIRALASTRGAQPPSLRAPGGGMQALVNALARALGDRVVRGRRTVALARQPDGFRASFADGGSVRARTVVVATPPPETAALLGPIAAELGDVLRQVVMRSSTSVVLGFGRGDVSLPEGSGLLVPRIEGAAFPSITFVHAKWPTRVRDDLAVVRAVVDPSRAPDVVTGDDDALIEAVLRELRRFVKLGEPRWAAIQRFPYASAVAEVGHRARVREARERAASLGGGGGGGALHLAGAAFDGPGIAGVLDGGKKLAEALTA